MMRAWWPRTSLAAALVFWTSVAAADAQTVFVRHAPAGATVEVQFGEAAGTGTIDQAGNATVQVTGSPAAAEEIAAAVYADLCGPTVRILLIGRGADPPAPTAACQRRSVPGFFVFRSGTSIVVDLEPNIPIVRIRQGRVPDEWLMEGPLRTGRTTPRGLVVFGGGGFGQMEDMINATCGNTSPCTRENTKLNFTGGVAYWLTRWLAIEGTFYKLGALEADGTGDRYEMLAEVSPRVATAAAVGGWSIGPVRFYGRAGGAYHRARVEVTQATFAETITVDGVITTFPASTQTFSYATVGWGRLLGFGVEGWVGDSAALFAEANWMQIRGENSDDNGGERLARDRIRALVAGVKVHIGHRR